ncbi:MAG: hypothetical protein Q9183_000696 [Haloplaca sp. 2 TL-2023]
MSTPAVSSRNSTEKARVDRAQAPTASPSPNWPKDWKAYAALVAGFFMMFNCWGMVNAYGAFLGLYDEHLMSTSSDLELSLIGATESFLLLAPSIFAGRLLDARRHYYLGFTGFLLLFLGYFLLSFSGGEGFKDQGNYGLWFPRKRYIAAGITSTGAGAGGIIYPLTFKFLVASYGFPVGVRILSSVVAGTTLVAFVLGTPCRDVPRRRVGGVSPALKATTWIDKEALRNKPYAIYVVAVALVYGGFYSVSFHVTEWAEVKGFGAEEDIPGGQGVEPGTSGFRTFWFLAIINGTSIIGRLASAMVATSWSNPIVVHAGTCFVAAILSYFFWPFASNDASAIAFCAIFGILGGSMLSLPASGVAYLIPEERQSHVGQWTGMMWYVSLCLLCQVTGKVIDIFRSGVSIFALVGPLIAAALKRRFGMNAIGYWTGSTMLLTAVLFVWSMYLKRKEGKRADNGTEAGSEKIGETTPSSTVSTVAG